MAFLLTVSPLGTPQALAHCPNQPAQINVWGDYAPVGGGDAVKATIPWTDPNVCSQNGSTSVSLENPSLARWVQAGWWKLSGSSVRGYCEAQGPGGNYAFNDFAITQSTHVYQQYYNNALGTWQCIFDSTQKRGLSGSYVGLTSAPWVTVQGEAKGQHVQIGKMAPGALLISAMQYMKASAEGWITLNVNLHAAPWPYGIAEPTAGQMQLWTNAHN